jgi:hypothetical protein
MIVLVVPNVKPNVKSQGGACLDDIGQLTLTLMARSLFGRPLGIVTRPLGSRIKSTVPGIVPGIPNSPEFPIPFPGNFTR